MCSSISTLKCFFSDWSEMTATFNERRNEEMESEKLFLAVKHIKLVYVCYLQWFTSVYNVKLVEAVQFIYFCL